MMGSWQFLLQIWTLINIGKELQKIPSSEHNIKIKLIKLWFAQFISFLSPLMSVIGAIVQLEIIFMLQFIFLATALGLVAQTTIRKGKSDT